MRTIGGVLLGILLFFPGVEFLRWLMVRVLGAYDAMTLTDGCLLMIMILLSVHLVRGRTAQPAERRRRVPRESDEYEEPQLQYLPGHDRPRPTRRTATSRTRRTTRRTPQ
jgi:hypothetical protein